MTRPLPPVGAVFHGPAGCLTVTAIDLTKGDVTVHYQPSVEQDR